MRIPGYLLACLLTFFVGCGTSTVTNDSVAVKSTADDLAASQTAQGETQGEAQDSGQSQDSQATPQERFESAKAEYDGEYQTFLKAYRAAKDDQGKQAAMELMPKPESFADRMLALADEHPDSEAAVDALVWTSSSLRGAAADAATKKLVESYRSNPKIAPIVMMMKYNRGDNVEGQLKELIESENAAIQAAAKYSLGSILIGRDSTSKEAIALLQSVVDDHADAEISLGNRSIKIAPEAEGELTEATKLQIGMVAPDIEGADLDGVEFKLSDYRGKVVVLDFWGNW